MFIFRSLCLSGIVLSAALGSIALFDRAPEMTSSYVSRGLLSAQTDQKEDAGPYRGSGRRGSRDAKVPGSSSFEEL
ncbi:MAG: hypothetical protein SWY16_01080 [Cyanobacteriota bacterium]|nr:hypothetical protein [Cyanobacteriota bacterium]